MPPFARLIHVDWSMHASKRVAAEAHREGSTWHVTAPHPVGLIDSFLGRLFAGPHPTLAGFDFPIGVPAAYGALLAGRLPVSDFAAALPIFGSETMPGFFDVADAEEEIAWNRPFYPRTYPKGRSPSHLHAALGFPSMIPLLRACERRVNGRKAACSLFWTLGGNQVGKGALTGWREVIRPARARGASLWPFDGRLSTLAARGGLTICETYPAEAYSHFGIHFSGAGGKRNQAARHRAVQSVLPRCEATGIMLDSEMKALLAHGFGPSPSGEDAFDAFAGLLGMIEVADNRRPEAPAMIADQSWEGWILGQAA